MADPDLSRYDRHYLEAYLRAEHRTITFAEVFRLYIPSLLLYGGAALVLAFFALVFVPSAPTISLNQTVCYCILSIFAFSILRSAYVARLSIGHWELLKRILNWQSVHALIDEDESVS